jgi:alpha/beta hydrolase family protein
MFGNESVHLSPQTDAYLRRRAELDLEYFRHASPELDRKTVKATLNVGLTFVGHRPAAAHGHPPVDEAPRQSVVPGGRVHVAPPGGAGHHDGFALPADVKRWWDALTPGQRGSSLHEHGAGLGALDGIPVVVRDQVNRAVLAEHEARLTEERDRLLAEARPGDLAARRLRDVQDRLDGLHAVRDRLAVPPSVGRPRPYLLALSTEGTGRVVVAFGDPDTAANVATYVPGAKARLGNAGAHMRVSDAIARAAWRAGSTSTAVIAWVGYDAPQTLTGALSRRFADIAAPRLHRFQDGLRVTHQGPRSHNTVIGYSYGSVVVGHAARDGVLGADDVVFTAGPGVGAGRAAELRLAGVPRHETGYHVHATIARWDFTRVLGAHGRQPAGRRFGARAFASAPGTRGRWYLGGLSGQAHRDYWLGDNPTLAEIGRIVAGRATREAG